MAQWISARLPPLGPVFDCRTRRLMWVESVFGFLPFSRVFLRVLRFSSLHDNNTSNSNLFTESSTYSSYSSLEVDWNKALLILQSLRLTVPFNVTVINTADLPTNSTDG